MEKCFETRKTSLAWSTTKTNQSRRNHSGKPFQNHRPQSLMDVWTVFAMTWWRLQCSLSYSDWTQIARTVWTFVSLKLLLVVFDQSFRTQLWQFTAFGSTETLNENVTLCHGGVKRLELFWYWQWRALIICSLSSFIFMGSVVQLWIMRRKEHLI